MKEQDPKDHDVNQLREELLAAYELLHDALPLAFKHLHAGGVPALDQYSFWAKLRTAEEHVETFYWGESMTELSAEFDNRMETLRQFQRGRASTNTSAQEQQK